MPGTERWDQTLASRSDIPQQRTRGASVRRLVVFVCVCALCSVTSTLTCGSTPFGGTPASIPGTIRAENFYEGGEGIAYHDTSVGNTGGEYRDTDVDIASDDVAGGFVVGWVGAGEWLAYTVDVAASGAY